MSTSQSSLNPAVTERTPLIATPASDRNHGNARSEVVLDPGTKPVRQVAPDALRGVLMMLMAFDHLNVNVATFPHGTAVHSENASQVVTEFSHGLGYVLRTASHLCASGFALLLGFGLVYFVSSRAQRSWSAGAQVGYLAKRALAILLVNEVTFLPFFPSMKIWLLNIILPALALDYLLIGLLVISLDYYIQPALERWYSQRQKSAAPRSAPVPHSTQDSQQHSTFFSWIIDTLLATLFFVATFSTIWSAPDQGRCVAHHSADMHQLSAPWQSAPNCKVSASLILQFFWLNKMCPNLGVVSVFPPLAWISFVLLGVIYARVILRLRIQQKGLLAFNVALGIVFALLFVSTRLLQYGNLSTDCLQTSAQLLHPNRNQYIASIKSFLYITKYNPDPAFVFATSSVNFFLLAFFGLLFSSSATRLLAALKTVLLTYGIQALFFYAFHQLFLFVFALALRTAVPGIFEPRDPDVFPRPDGLGWTGYFCVYAVAMVVCYYACREFARFKARRGPDSVWRFV
ncbi:hypothetical protein OC844_006359 [Tilletia horrida]|nr:hypothetical protein OC844_006359 [Tilletia horrida]